MDLEAKLSEERTTNEDQTQGSDVKEGKNSMDKNQSEPMHEEPIGQESFLEADHIGEKKDGQKSTNSKSSSIEEADSKDIGDKAIRKVGRPKRSTNPDKLASAIAPKKQCVEDRQPKSKREPLNYQEMVACVNLLSYLDWDKVDPKTHQNSPYYSSQMTPMCYWFMVCCRYFPRGERQKCFEVLKTFRNEMGPKPALMIHNVHSLVRKADGLNGRDLTRKKLKTQSDDIPIGDLKAILNDKKLEKRLGKHGLQYSFREDVALVQNRALALSILSPEAKSLSLEDQLVQSKKHSLPSMIAALERRLEDQIRTTDEDIHNLGSKMLKELNEELLYEGTYNPNALMKDLQCRFQAETQFLDCMEYKQQNAVTHNIINSQERMKDKYTFPEKERPKKEDDYVCQICNDGDYTESNKIVFCERCNISFHQRCYGITNLPEGSWICDLCKYYGPEGRFVRCALCSRRGGCLRRTNIEARSEFWKTRNPIYYEAMMQKPSDESEPPRLYKDGQDTLDNVEINSQNFADFLYYDYYEKLDKFRPGDEEKEPSTHMAWVHYSCCMWIPELEFTSDPVPNHIARFDQIDKRRFGFECLVCRKKEGACVQCSSKKCQESFHVECARRTKIFMEAKNSDNRYYTIYCEKHAPSMAKRKLEANTISISGDITKFCKNIEKFYDSYKYKRLDQPKEEETPNYIRNLKKLQAEKDNQAAQDRLLKNLYMREVRSELQKFPDFGNVLTFHMDSSGEVDRVEYTEPPKAFLKTTLRADHKVWPLLAQRHNWPQNAVYKKYKRILEGSTESLLDGLVKSKQVRIARDEELVEEFDDTPYCICQKPWRGETMIECEGCKSWFHPGCHGLFDLDPEKLAGLNFKCKNCKEEEGDLGKRSPLNEDDEREILERLACNSEHYSKSRKSSSNDSSGSGGSREAESDNEITELLTASKAEPNQPIPLQEKDSNHDPKTTTLEVQKGCKGQNSPLQTSSTLQNAN